MAKEAGIQWSGLETEGMREARSSLVLPIDVTYQPKIKSLAPEKVVVQQDVAAKKTGPSSHLVDFLGCTTLQLVPSPGARHPAMPVTITVAGKCHFTLDNYEDFTIMMRTDEESRNWSLPPNSAYEWPDVRSLLLCPLCSAMAKLPKDERNEYWMVFYPLLQVVVSEHSQMTLATRTICRLVCVDCMQQLLDGPGMSLTVKQAEKSNAVTFSLTAMEILQEAGTVSFLQDGPPRPETHPHVDDPMDAWTLYTLWESTGAWKALQNDYRSAVARSLAIAPGTPEDPGYVKTKNRYGRKCGNPQCDKLHGKKGSDGSIIRLSVVCDTCRMAYYCSNSCRQKAWTEHSLGCESGKKRVKLVQCDACKKTLAYTQMKKCSRCRSSVYCSVDCQRGDWAQHKPGCKKVDK